METWKYEGSGFRKRGLKSRFIQWQAGLSTHHPSRWKYEWKSFIKSGLNRRVVFGLNTNVLKYKIKIQFKLHEHSVVSHLDGLLSEFPLCLVGLGEE